MDQNKRFTAKTHLLICLAFLLGSPLSAQVFPTASDQPVWTFRTIEGSIGVPRIKLYTDPELTIANDLEWTTVYEIDYITEITDGPIWFDTNDTFALTQYAVEDQKVWMRRATLFDVEQGLLYDFSLEAGDQVSVLAPGSMQTREVLYQVDSTDVYTCNGQAYKRLHVHFEYDIPNWNRVYYRSTWITGIGDVYFPFFPASCYGPTCHWEYRDPKLFLGQDSLDLREAYPCALLTGIPAPKWEYTPKPVLSPNPASAGQAVHIDFPEQVAVPNWSVVVYRSDGQLVTQAGIRSWNEQAYHLSAGLYWFAFYREDGEHLKTMPLVVQ